MLYPMPSIVRRCYGCVLFELVCQRVYENAHMIHAQARRIVNNNMTKAIEFMATVGWFRGFMALTVRISQDIIPRTWPMTRRWLQWTTGEIKRKPIWDKPG